MATIRTFLDDHFRHFNARETVDAARGYEAHLAAGGKMLVSLAGAMSTAKLGTLLARLIRAGKVHAISCTGANLEEDLFNLLAYSYRKLGNFDTALEHYQTALRIDPNHRGANEYIGELYLETGNLAKAEEHLAVLKKVCKWGCESRTELTEAINEYKRERGG